MKEIQRHLNLFLLIDVSSDRSYFGNSIPRLLEGSEGNKEEEKKKKKNSRPEPEQGHDRCICSIYSCVIS